MDLLNSYAALTDSEVLSDGDIVRVGVQYKCGWSFSCPTTQDFRAITESVTDLSPTEVSFDSTFAGNTVVRITGVIRNGPVTVGELKDQIVNETLNWSGDQSVPLSNVQSAGAVEKRVAGRGIFGDSGAVGDIAKDVKWGMGALIVILILGIVFVWEIKL